MAKNSLKAPGAPPEDLPAVAWPAPAPAAIAGAAFDQEDTWMTFGLGAEGEDDDRTVTVVFSRCEDETSEFLGRPLSPLFPGRR